ncbi:MAG: glycosyltransferase WbuB [Chloroflexi bacterium]|nr:MAG: glycosyltransferase WbuB [Chloroflexota bacterium]
MRILNHDRSGHPFQVQLSRELARRGHQVLHSYATFFQTPKGSLSKLKEDPDTFDVVGIELDEPFQKYAYLKRRAQELKYSRLLIDQIQAFSPDVVILANVPPDAQTAVYKALKHTNKKLVFWVQDLYGIAIKKILNKKLPLLGEFVGGYYSWLEKKLLLQSDEIVLITEDFHPLMSAWGVSKEKTHVIPNWAPLNELPVRPKNNEWAINHSLEDKFCILYSGTLGMKHNPDLLLQLARHFQDKPNIEIVVVSEGLGADWLQEQKQRYNLGNLKLMPFQPFLQYPNVLGSSDILVAILEPDAGIFSVPSKVLSYLCSERPLLLAVPLENLAARIVTQHKAGVVVDPLDIEGFVAAANDMIDNHVLSREFAKNGRSYAEKMFNIEMIGRQFEKIILTMLH